MALGRGPDKKVNSDTRDVEGDFLKALIYEYESYKAAGLHDRAELVAAELRKRGHEVRPAKPATGAKERAVSRPAMEKAVEADSPPKRRGRPPKVG